MSVTHPEQDLQEIQLNWDEKCQMKMLKNVCIQAGKNIGTKNQ